MGQRERIEKVALVLLLSVPEPDSSDIAVAVSKAMSAVREFDDDFSEDISFWDMKESLKKRFKDV